MIAYWWCSELFIFTHSNNRDIFYLPWRDAPFRTFSRANSSPPRRLNIVAPFDITPRLINLYSLYTIFRFLSQYFLHHLVGKYFLTYNKPPLTPDSNCPQQCILKNILSLHSIHLRVSRHQLTNCYTSPRFKDFRNVTLSEYDVVNHGETRFNLYSTQTRTLAVRYFLTKGPS